MKSLAVFTVWRPTPISNIVLLASTEAVTIFAVEPAVTAIPESTAVPVGSTMHGPHVCIQKWEVSMAADAAATSVGAAPEAVTAVGVAPIGVSVAAVLDVMHRL